MQSNRTSGYAVFVHLAAAALAVMVLLVSSENRRLEAQLRQANTVEAGIDAGAPLPEVTVADLAGRESQVTYQAGSPASVFLVFDPTCGSCNENLPRWQELYERYKDDYRFIGVSLETVESTQVYAEANGLPYPIVVPRDSAGFISSYGINRVPMTLVADSEGFAVEARVGVLPEAYAEDFGERVPAS
ncbi:MAG: TlpA disulfide reductase family protein [Acidobacteriota bacterium]